MHIKNIRIAGFRSYHNQNFNSELSPKHNVIVGRNGSGKSNFFAAIQFVLSERFASLSAEERKSLFHEGAGRAYSMFVEITFDNSAGRLVIPGRALEPEVSIRRTLGLKQDEFRVNGKSFSPSEVRQLLESAGFSSSNPYYIVEQGKIVTLAHLRGEERYALLKEIAGTNVYENRRAESISLLESTSQKQNQISDAIGQLHGRLSQLESETSELKSFQESDYRRRVIEHTIFDYESENAKASLDALESQWKKKPHAGDQPLRDGEAELSRRQAEALRLAHEISSLEAQRKVLERELEENQRNAAKFALQVGDQREQQNRNAAERKGLQTELAELRSALSTATSDLAKKSDAMATRTKEAQQSAEGLRKAEVALSILQAKRGRKSRFASRQDRDQWLQEEIARNERLLKERQTQLDKTTKSATDLRSSIVKERSRIDSLRKNLSSANDSSSTDAETRDALLRKRDEVGSKRRKAWSVMNDHETDLRRAAEGLEACKRMFDKCVRHDIRIGLASLQECLDEMRDPVLRARVYGQVVELMTADSSAVAAIDVVAGNALFNVVVDTFETSNRILQHFNKNKKPGRLTFIPLDIVNTKPLGLPTNSAMSPLIDHVKFDKRFGAVFADLFGKTMLIRNLEDGPKVIKEFDCNAVTFDGDQFSRKGGITGGFIDQRSKYKAAMDLMNAREAVEKATQVVAADSQKMAELEQEISKILRELDAIASRTEVLKFKDSASELRVAEESLARLEQTAQQAESTTETMKNGIPEIKAVIEALSKEIQQDFKSTLTSDEESQLTRLQKEVLEVRTASGALQSAVIKMKAECQMLNDTTSHLQRRIHAVEDRLGALSSVNVASSHDVANLDAEIAEVSKGIRSIDTKLEALLTEKRGNEEAVSLLRQQIAEATRANEDHQDAIDRVHNQRALLLKKKEEAQANMRKLGAIAPTDTAAMKQNSIGKLMQMLKSVNDELKKFVHVNKKALDQYTQLRNAFDDMNQQKENLAKEYDSVQRLIAHLDKQKGEAIERTFKQVQFHFEEVFKQLVPADGSFAKLELIQAPQPNPDPYNAVKISVSFGLGTTQELAQLSGGQKSLVALALIFAIQRSDPAPFYLFDEIDAALDSDYRTSVAHVLKQQAEHCQFLTASFKTEMLDVADTCFGIFFSNKVSQIKKIEHSEAAALLRQAAQDERKRDREVPLEMPNRSAPSV